MTSARTARVPTAAEVEARIRHASALSDLSEGTRLAGKIDMRPAAVEARLREASELLKVCQRLADAMRGRDETATLEKSEER